MSKVITVTSLRNGVGRTSVTCLIGLKLAEIGLKTLIIDNNYKYCDVANYLMLVPEYSLDDLKPFLRSGVVDKATIKSMTVNAEKNLDVLSGSTMSFMNNILEKEDISKIKGFINDEYDYILVDSRAGIEHKDTLDLFDIIDKNIIVTIPNKFEKSHYDRIYNTLEKEKTEKLDRVFEKSLLVVNRVIENINFDTAEYKDTFGTDKIFSVMSSDKITNFFNGFQCQQDSINEKEITRIVNAINNIEVETSKTKKLDISETIKSIKSIFKVS